MQSVQVTVMSFYLVTMTSFCSQRGEGVKKGQKIAVILNVWPLNGPYIRITSQDKLRNGLKLDERTRITGQSQLGAIH